VEVAWRLQVLKVSSLDLFLILVERGLIDFPRFNGNNVNQWIYEYENFFLIDKTTVDFRFKLVIVHMEGCTLQWHFTLAETTNCSYFPWLEYKKLTLEKFGDACDDLKADLMKLRKS